MENLGRVNYGTKLFDRKGLLEGVRLGQQFHFGWDMYCLTMEDLSKLSWRPEGTADRAGQPLFLRGDLVIEGAPADTFLRVPHADKGFCVVNGFNIGRFWNTAGPQKTLYVPAPLLRRGHNEIILFASDSVGEAQVIFEDSPDLG